MSNFEDRLSKPSTKAGRLQRECLALLREHERDRALPTSGRFVYYELVDRGTIPKVYRKPDGTPKPRTPAQDVADALYHLRDNGVVPWSWIVDETRNLASWDYASSVYQYVENNLPYARIDLWGGESPPLVLCESRSLAGVLRRIASTYLCPIAATNGQAGGFLHTDVGPLIDSAAGAVQRVFYLGDLDLSGGHIEANTRKVLSCYGSLEWEKIAITQEQQRERNLTVVQKPDHRFKPIKYYDAIETEALRQTEIQRVLIERLDKELPEPLTTFLEEEENQRVLVREKLQNENGADDGELDEEVGSVPAEVIDTLATRVEDEIHKILQAVEESAGGRFPLMQRIQVQVEMRNRLAGRLRRSKF